MSGTWWDSLRFQQAGRGCPQRNVVAVLSDYYYLLALFHSGLYCLGIRLDWSCKVLCSAGLVPGVNWWEAGPSFRPSGGLQSQACPSLWAALLAAKESSAGHAIPVTRLKCRITSYSRYIGWAKEMYLPLCAFLHFDIYIYVRWMSCEQKDIASFPQVEQHQTDRQASTLTVSIPRFYKGMINTALHIRSVTLNTHSAKGKRWDTALPWS